MKRLYIPGIEERAKPGGVYERVIEKTKSEHPEYPKIWDLFAFGEDFTGHLARFTNGLLRTPAVISPGLRELVAAYTYVAQGMGQGVPLVLAGYTPAAWGTPRFPDLPAYIEELGLAPYVRWIGPVDEVDKPALYRLASVFAFPSLLEGFGLGPLEALASGTPVVACEASSIPEVTGDAAYLVAPGDSRAMGGAILSLLMQPDHAATLRNRGLARARDFSWRATAEGTLAAYEQVLGAR